MSYPSYPDVVKPDDMSIAYLWLAFAGYVLPPQVSAVQRTEMRKAFFAGFTECFKVMNDYATKLPEAEAVKLFERLEAESHEFYLKMKKEYSP